MWKASTGSNGASFSFQEGDSEDLFTDARSFVELLTNFWTLTTNGWQSLSTPLSTTINSGKYFPFLSSISFMPFKPFLLFSITYINFLMNRKKRNGKLGKLFHKFFPIFQKFWIVFGTTKFLTKEKILRLLHSDDPIYITWILYN